MAARYDARAAHHQAVRDRERRAAGRLSVARLVAALALAACVAAGIGGELSGRVASASGTLLLAAFVALAIAHRRAENREREADVLTAVNARGARRVRREWSALPAPAWPATAAPVAEDLDLLGRPSLAHLLDVVTPAVGAPRLLAWLLADPSSAEVIEARQRAAAEAAGRPGFLESCAAAALAAHTVAPRVVEAFLRWAEGSPGRRGHGAALLADAPRRAGPLLAAGAAVSLAFGIGGTRATAALLGALALNLALAGAAHPRLRRVLAGMGDVPALLRPALRLLRRFDAEPLAAPTWLALQARWRAGDGPAAMQRLEQLLAWSEARYSPMGHWVLNALVAYDAHLLAAFDAWRLGAGGAARGWVDALGEAEALAALATLAHDNPGWAWPALAGDDEEPAVDARGLAHPLLPPPQRIGNDVRLDGAGSLLVITGSNMAGKTTLLRAIGLNVLLAQAGGPVCAGAMRWRRVRVRTSVRVRDALGEGVSLYLAELRRLRAVVDDAVARPDAGANAGRAPVLHLFDEILHGTNSRDRRTATRAVLRRLSAAGALGVVTTHDLELADEPALASRTRHLHFRESYAPSADGPRMRFDYVAHPGKATGANALALLALLGLDDAGVRTEP